MTWFEAPWWGCQSSDVGLSFFRIEYAFLMNNLIGTVVDGSAQSTAESMRIAGVARSRVDIPGVSKRQKGEPAFTCGGGKLGETRTELIVRFWSRVCKYLAGACCIEVKLVCGSQTEGMPSNDRIF